MRTFISAASIALISFASGFSQEKHLSTAELAAQEKINASVAVLTKSAKPLGMAVLIDSKGLFLAHRLSVKSNSMAATMPNGRTLVLKLIQQDDPSQMVLLKANDWRTSFGAPVKLVNQGIKPGDKIIAIMPSGLARAEFAGSNLFGVISENRRLIPLSEIRLEAPIDQIGGAAVFTLDGDLIGIIGAALKQQEQYNTTSQQRASLSEASKTSLRGTVGGAGQKAGAVDLKGVTNFSQQFGPTALTVAYVAGQSIMDRVIRGFTSPNNEVEHPTIGIYCRDSVRGGALIDNVIPNSPAERAGLRVGDIIFELAGLPVRNQLDFAKAMINQSVGQRITVKVIRNKDMLNLSVTIGK